MSINRYQWTPRKAEHCYVIFLPLLRPGASLQNAAASKWN